MKQINWKSIAAYAGIVLLFAVAAAVYFWPSLQGKVIYALTFSRTEAEHLMKLTVK